MRRITTGLWNGGGGSRRDEIRRQKISVKLNRQKSFEGVRVRQKPTVGDRQVPANKQKTMKKRERDSNGKVKGAVDGGPPFGSLKRLKNPLP